MLDKVEKLAQILGKNRKGMCCGVIQENRPVET